MMVKSRERARKVIMVLLFLLSVTGSAALAGQVIDEFDSPNLNQKLWDIQAEGDADFGIADGVLTLSSPNTESGIILYYPFNVEGVDASIEVKLETSGMVESLIVGCMADTMAPQINTDIGNNTEASFIIIPANWYVKQDPVNVGEKPPNPGIQGPYQAGWNVVRLECSESKGEVRFFLNDEDVGMVDKNPDVQNRYFYVTCDPYTSHYSGEMYIDYIKLTGQGVAVEPMGKTAITWGSLKTRY